jgi:hypothetical protein
MKPASPRPEERELASQSAGTTVDGLIESAIAIDATSSARLSIWELYLAVSPPT